MQLTALSLSFAAVAVQGAAVMTTRDAPLKGYNVFVPQWEFEVTPGEKIVINGTIEEARNQLA
ncbi:hypothetical protein CPLU01_15200 [Colletotrichum plurivorum]|uniref:Uncharacterized protein n=1 Tax=Colletotrichum plurivorum TaxID=2175906 RepID=A0A8H6MWL4_9PEZI|nr:hypothetical protein CPLU01_15200 [Colletotrichum plurivorum]